MAALTNIELGSVLCGLVNNIPANISGTLAFLIDQSLYDVNNYTGDNVTGASIPDRYQPVVMNLSLAQVYGQMEEQGTGNKSIKLGDLTVQKDSKENSAETYKKIAEKQLNSLGHKMSYYTTWN